MSELIRVPDIGSGEGEVIELLVKVGDRVEAEQSILTLESDKASMEVPSPKAGVIKSLKVKLGDKLKTGDELLELEVEGQDHLVMIKAVDQNVLTLDVDHADLLNVKRGEKVEVDVPVVFTGEAAPGALVTQEADVITILADVLNIPEEITVDVEGKEIGDQILASDLQMPGNASLVSEEDTLIINVVEPEEEELPEDTDEEGAEGAEGEAAVSEGAQA